MIRDPIPWWKWEPGIFRPICCAPPSRDPFSLGGRPGVHAGPPRHRGHRAQGAGSDDRRLAALQPTPGLAREPARGAAAHLGFPPERALHARAAREKRLEPARPREPGGPESPPRSSPADPPRPLRWTKRTPDSAVAFPEPRPDGHPARRRARPGESVRGVWTTGRWASMGGDAWPERTLEVAGGVHTFLGGVEGDWRREKWLGEDLSLRSLRAWTAPPARPLLLRRDPGWRDGGSLPALRSTRHHPGDPPACGASRLLHHRAKLHPRRSAVRLARPVPRGGPGRARAGTGSRLSGSRWTPRAWVQEGGKRSGIEASARVPPVLQRPLRRVVLPGMGQGMRPTGAICRKRAGTGSSDTTGPSWRRRTSRSGPRSGWRDASPWVVPFLAPEDPGDELPGEAAPEGESERAPGFSRCPITRAGTFACSSAS